MQEDARDRLVAIRTRKAGKPHMPHPLLDATDTAQDIGEFLATLNEIGWARAVSGQPSSGAISYRVTLDDQDWFLKTGPTDASARALRRVVDLHARVVHPAIVPVLNSFHTAGVPVTVGPWRDGHVLLRSTTRRHPQSPRIDESLPRFRALPLATVHAALDTILDAHLALDAAGYVAVDPYDGCLLYDFATARMHLVDLDDYQPPFVPIPASRSGGPNAFAAATQTRWDSRNTRADTVYLLGRTLRLLMDAGSGERAWRGTLAQLAVVERATSVRPAARHPHVAALTEAWRAATPETLRAGQVVLSG